MIGRMGWNSNINIKLYKKCLNLLEMLTNSHLFEVISIESL